MFLCVCLCVCVCVCVCVYIYLHYYKRQDTGVDVAQQGHDVVDEELIGTGKRGILYATNIHGFQRGASCKNNIKSTL